MTPSLIMKTAARIRNLHGIKTHKISLSKIISILESYNISLVSYTKLSTLFPKVVEQLLVLKPDAYSINDCDLHRITIFYNDIGVTRERIKFTLCHELGHFILQHNSKAKYIEFEADYFARQLLAPAILVAQCPPKDVAKIFDISSQCAEMAVKFNQKDMGYLSFSKHSTLLASTAFRKETHMIKKTETIENYFINTNYNRELDNEA